MFEARRAIAGRKAKFAGQSFEQWLERSFARIGWFLLRIPDGCKATGPQGKFLIREKAPFDFVAFGPNKEIIFFDAKVRSGAKNPQPSMFRPRLTRKGKIDSLANQIAKLSKIAFIGHCAGFVMFLPDTGQIHFVDIKDIASAKSKVIGSFSEGICVVALK